MQDKDNQILEESKIEEIKRNSKGLRGDLEIELQNELDTFSTDSEQVLKFHGIYNQDNRDVRAERKRAGLDVEHICMIRLALPGGRLSSSQYLAVDELANRFGKRSLRVTTRQGLQFHFVSKHDVRSIIKNVNGVLLTTYAGCGDVVRNVTACPSPSADVEHLALGELANEISKRYKPKSSAYYELWVDGDKVAGLDTTTDPIYGATYLPRKFKIGVASASDNCIDVLSCDVALVIDKSQPELVKIFVGGGLGRSHSDDSTKPLLAKPLTVVDRSEVFSVIDAIITLQRDNGDRKDRSHARFKYLVDSWGIDRIREQLCLILGSDLAPLDSHHFDVSEDHLGWIDQGDGRWALGIKVPSGRITDNDGGSFKSGIRKAVETFGTSVRLTAKEDVILSGIEEDDRGELTKLLAQFSIPLADDYKPLSRFAFACPALPTCGLALAESERFLPTFLDRLAAVSAEVGLEQFDAEVRMTGCPNGCARPYLGEIGIVGRSKKSYDVYLGADRVGNRLGQLYAQDVNNDNLAEALRPVLSLFAKESELGEGFGDFCERYGVADLRRFAPEPRRRRVAVS